MSTYSILLAGMTGLFALAMGYVVIFILYQRRMIARDLERQKLETDHQKKMLQAIIENQEAERKRVAHDLHDEVGALLTASKLYFNQLSPGRAEEQLVVISGKVNLLFDEMMTSIRRISHDLRPIVLENFGLLEAIEDVQQKVGASGIAVDFTHQLTFSIHRDGEVMLYRIIQELISNTLKHARASRIAIHMEEFSDRMELVYSDDGIGFQSLGAHQGLGLKSIESRLSLLEGNLQRKQTAKGVHLVIQIPKNNIKKTI